MNKQESLESVMATLLDEVESTVATIKMLDVEDFMEAGEPEGYDFLTKAQLFDIAIKVQANALYVINTNLSI